MINFLFAALAIMASEPLDDPALEARAQDLMREIRCVACENEPVSQSAAPIADDMRAKIRELVADGASDAEVRGWFRARYGDHALFRPSTDRFGWLLWGLPFGFLLAALGVGFAIRGGRAKTEAEAVPPEETGG